MKKKLFSILLILFLFIILHNGCMRFVLRLSPSLVPNLANSIFEECDPELAKSSIPANLKMLEGILKSDPENRGILTALCMGFCGYSLLFVEEVNPYRASDLYLRARDYGIKALGHKGKALRNIKSEKIKSLLKSIDGKEIEALLWTTISWNAWINLNLDKPAALSQLGVSQACLERVIEIDADYMHGLPYILMGVSLSARPPMFGGDINKARHYFETALNLNNRKFFLTQFYFARYYAVRAQDRDLFSGLIKEIINGDPGELKGVCLINAVIRYRARELSEMAKELFM